ncbi:hypothetical protein MNBD_ALPHA06-1807, partial [hydrothermal vent metagenome]
FAQDDIHAMDDTRYNPSMTASRFEAGTPPVPNIYASRAGLAVLKNVGLLAIEQRIAKLTAHIIAKAEAAGYTLATPSEPERHGAMIAMRANDENAAVQALEKRGIVTSCRDGNIRISPHAYNTKADIDAVFEVLETCQQDWL